MAQYSEVCFRMYVCPASYAWAETVGPAHFTGVKQQQENTEVKVRKENSFRIVGRKRIPWENRGDERLWEVQDTAHSSGWGRYMLWCIRIIPGSRKEGSVCGSRRSAGRRWNQSQNRYYWWHYLSRFSFEEVDLIISEKNRIRTSQPCFEGYEG